MEAIAIITTIIQHAPTVIKTVDELWTWGRKTWDEIKAASGKDESSITPDELVQHIRVISGSSGLIQDIP